MYQVDAMARPQSSNQPDNRSLAMLVGICKQAAAYIICTCSVIKQHIWGSIAHSNPKTHEGCVSITIDASTGVLAKKMPPRC